MADENTNVVDPTESLRTVLNDPLLKSKPAGEDGGGEDDEDGDDKDYKPEAMKKHMKRFMKENKSYMKDCLKNFEEAKDLKKSLQAEFEASKEELGTADMVMLDGTSILEKSVKATDKLAKATEGLMKGLGDSFNELKVTQDILMKACAVIVDLSDKVKVLSTEPVLQKAVTSTANIPAGKPGEVANEPMAKAKELGYVKIKDRLLKSAIADPNLNAYVGMLDSCGGRFERLDTKALATIVAIASKEG